jgi:flagellar basal-body rod protein FlgC
MNFLDALQISGSGMSSQSARMNVIATNLANAEATRTPEGGPYKRKEVLLGSVPFKEVLEGQNRSLISESKVLGVVQDTRPPQMKYDPGHPDADAKGYVALPNVNVVQEMVNMMLASRSYEANVTAVQATKDMAMRALEIGK